MAGLQLLMSASAELEVDGKGLHAMCGLVTSREVRSCTLHPVPIPGPPATHSFLDVKPAVACVLTLTAVWKRPLTSHTNNLFIFSSVANETAGRLVSPPRPPGCLTHHRPQTSLECDSTNLFECDFTSFSENNKCDFTNSFECDFTSFSEGSNKALTDGETLSPARLSGRPLCASPVPPPAPSPCPSWSAWPGRPPAGPCRALRSRRRAPPVRPAGPPPAC